MLFVAREPDLLRRDLAEFLRGSMRVEVLGDTADATVGGACAVASDDLGAPGLRATLRMLGARLGWERVALLCWDRPRRLRLLLGLPIGQVLFLPDERSRLPALAQSLAPSSVPASHWTLDPRLNPILADALGLALRRSRNPWGPPPPSTGTDLTVQSGCCRSYLSELAVARGVCLRSLLDVCRLAWLLGRAGGRGEAITTHLETAGWSRRSTTALLQRCVGFGLRERFKLTERAVEEELQARLAAVIVRRASDSARAGRHGVTGGRMA